MGDSSFQLESKKSSANASQIEDISAKQIDYKNNKVDQKNTFKQNNQLENKSQFSKEKEKLSENLEKKVDQKVKGIKKASKEPNPEKKTVNKIKSPQKQENQQLLQQLNKTQTSLQQPLSDKIEKKNPIQKLAPIMIEKGIQTDIIKEKIDKQEIYEQMPLNSPKEQQKKTQQKSKFLTPKKQAVQTLPEEISQQLPQEPKQEIPPTNSKLKNQNKRILPDLIKSVLKTTGSQTISQSFASKATQTNEQPAKERNRNVTKLVLEKFTQTEKQQSQEQTASQTTFFQSTLNQFYPKQALSPNQQKQSVFTFAQQNTNLIKKINSKVNQNSYDLIPEQAQTARLPAQSPDIFQEKIKMVSIGSDQQMKEMFSNFQGQMNASELLSDPVSQSMVQNNQIFKKVPLQASRNFPQSNQSQYKNQPSFEQFKEFIAELNQVHGKKCGKKCVHLKRFYEKLGLGNPWLNKIPYGIHQKMINKLPNIWVKEEKNKQMKVQTAVELCEQ